MVRRLVLGCSSVGQALVEAIDGRRGDLYVLTADAGWATALRDGNVSAVEADPTDPENYPEAAEFVVVAGDDPERNLTAAERAREAYPDAYVLAYVGADPDRGVREALHRIADRVVDPKAAVADRVLDAAGGENGTLTHGLLAALRTVAGPLAVVTHDNPDPDAIASALGLVAIAESFGVAAEACYFGEISHQENRALVNLLDIDLVHLTEVDLSEWGAVALVDHSRAGVNDSLPEDTEVDIVVDHHPPRGPVSGAFVDVRPHLGATSTMVAEYLRRLGVEPDRQVATALLYGIRIDTRNFTREVHREDFDAAAELLRHADEETLQRVESPSIDAETMRTVARAVRNRDVRGPVLASCVGEIGNRDALAQAAERLLDMEGISVTFVYGFTDGVVYASARARGADVDLGETLRDALGQIGSAGGHADMAGAQVPMGILSDVEESARESLSEIVEEFVAERFFETLAAAPDVQVRDTDPLTKFPHD